MTGHDIVEGCLNCLKKEGAQKAQVTLTETEKTGLAIENRRIFLLRDSVDLKLDLAAISADRYASLSLNNLEAGGVEAAARQTLENTLKSPQDTTYDIAPFQAPENFDNNVLSPDMELLYRRFEEFLLDCEKHPSLTLRRMTRLDFFSEKKILTNSNGTNFSSRVGFYEFNAIFSSREGGKNSLGYFTTLRAKNLDRPLVKWGMLETLLEQSAESINTRSVSGKFVGDIVVAPECLSDFLSFMTESALRDNMLISGTSLYKDSVGKLIAGAGFTLSSEPLSPEMAAGYFITPDGRKARDLPIIENGVLKTFILSQYGSRKTGLPLVLNAGGCYSVAPGNTDYKALIKSIARGLLVTRFSGGKPSQNGDFSGVVKNSFYIENGELKFPVAETMIAGNIPLMFMNINGISKERVNFGNAIHPWISFSGVTISGK
ncbi:MAG: metallopeptidase TldD-related protein [Elusimicrobiales bacterium]|nr:metallopeptidase TldD-related protein [Elusimicrobiales bacterium]